MTLTLVFPLVLERNVEEQKADGFSDRIIESNRSNRKRAWNVSEKALSRLPVEETNLK